MRDFGAEAQAAAEAHLEACWDAYDVYEDGFDEVVSPASAPFDGCPTCVVRETLFAVWGVLDAYVDDAFEGSGVGRPVLG